MKHEQVILILHDRQLVDEESATIDGAQNIGFEKSHRELQRIDSPESPEYRDLHSQIHEWIMNVKKEIDSKSR